MRYPLELTPSIVTSITYVCVYFSFVCILPSAELTPTYTLCLIRKDQSKQWCEVTGSIVTNFFQGGSSTNNDNKSSSNENKTINDVAAVRSSPPLSSSSHTIAKKKQLDATTRCGSITSLKEQQEQQPPRDTQHILLCLRPLRFHPSSSGISRMIVPLSQYHPSH